MTVLVHESAQGYALAQRPLVLKSRRVDRWLAGALLVLVCIGIVMVFDASFFLGQERFGDPYAMLRKHLASLALAGVAAAFLAGREPERYHTLAYPALAVGLALLVLVLVPGIGQVRGGARRWLWAVVFSFEPSELLKPIFVIYLAHSLARKKERLTDFAYGVLPHLIVAMAAIVLLLLEPDFGTAVLLGLLTMVMLFAAGARALHLVAICAPALPAAGLLILLKPYRWARLLGFMNPWGDAQAKGFQLVQSFLAFGAGGVFGVGLGNSNQKLFYLPEGHTDFIFALIGEELGFTGAVCLLACFAIVAVRGFRVAIRSADPFSSLLAFGATFILVGQAAMNIGVVLGMLPTKGLALPFVSYGGSALVANGICTGILLGLSREVR